MLVLALAVLVAMTYVLIDVKLEATVVLVMVVVGRVIVVVEVTEKVVVMDEVIVGRVVVTSTLSVRCARILHHSLSQSRSNWKQVLTGCYRGCCRDVSSRYGLRLSGDREPRARPGYCGADMHGVESGRGGQPYKCISGCASSRDVSSRSLTYVVGIVVVRAVKVITFVTADNCVTVFVVVYGTRVLVVNEMEVTVAMTMLDGVGAMIVDVKGTVVDSEAVLVVVVVHSTLTGMPYARFLIWTGAAP